IIERKDFLGEPKKGKLITIFGDTRSIPDYTSFVMGSDVLVHEATFSQVKKDLAISYFHSTTVQAAQLAKNSETKTLILTHLSSRYQIEDEKDFIKEARDVFPNTFLAYDFF